MKIIHKNKKAYFDYEILEELTAGIVLTGSEVKSVRSGDLSLKGSYVSMQGKDVFLKSVNISRYAYDQSKDYDPLRVRKLLLKQKEIEKIASKLNTQGVTLVPLAIGSKGAYIKVLIAIVRGRKQHDKRQVLKERTMKREADRAIRRY
ncbi:SsrA-binding protein [Candidatus Peregrinibacteria bacterium CG_4_10_14_0_2_um_filter_43_11]|nr:MAG: SsrA-binding protein [Candidatus Peregrinibacteria bacterium CG_4_10_14_0_2_um_filter_43_11]